MFLSCPQTGGKRIDAFIHKWREITSDPEILSIVLGLQDYFALQTSIVLYPLRAPVEFSTHCERLSSKRSPDRCRGGESPYQRSHSTQVSPLKEDFFSRLFLSPKKGRASRLVIRLSFLNKSVENFHFQMESLLERVSQCHQNVVVSHR